MSASAKPDLDLTISRVIKAAGALTVLSLGLVIAMLFRRENYRLPGRRA